jgi:hypothetical protein
MCANLSSVYSMLRLFKKEGYATITPFLTAVIPEIDLTGINQSP